MRDLLRRLNNWWVLSVILAVFCAVLLVFVLPLLLHGLRPWPWRMLLLSAVVLIWAAAAVWRVISARRASERLARALAPQAGEMAAEGIALSKRMGEAMAKLKAEGKGKRDYLYSRPWYVIIGPPGAGKTTALLNSGLRFPVASAAMKGVGGTRNLDFWFAEEAVLVDTAGRYTSQDSSEARDREGWRRFLTLLRVNRPLQPINGVLVAIGLDTLAASDGAALDRHAHIIRDRLNELRDGLGAVAPVYVVFTKTDLLAGFSEFFDDLDFEGRRAVLGATLPLETASGDAVAYACAFDSVIQAVADRSASRIQAELDTRRRGLIIGFPGQLEALRDRVVRFLDEAFRPEEDGESALFRGFYFTSGVQQGTPLDALLAGVPLDDSRVSDGPAHGRAYFLNRLLKEVAFNESGLSRPTAAAHKRRTTMLTAAYSAIAVVGVLLLLSWTSSFLANLGYQKRVAVAAADASAKLQRFDLKQVSASDPGVGDTLEALDALRGIPGGYEDRHRKGFPGVPLGLGMFDDGLSRSVEQAYLGGLQRLLAPRLLLRLEDDMHHSREPTVDLYSALRAYRLLGGDAPPNILRSEIGSVATWVNADWANATLPGGDNAPVRERLSLHLAAMLSDKDLGRVWPDGRRAPLDPDLISSTQNLLAHLTPGQRGYALLVETPAAGPAWSPKLTDAQLRAFANPQAINAISVPFLFTREGYVRQYQGHMLEVLHRLDADNWVLGGPQGRSFGGDLAVAPEIADIYAREYAQKWRSVLTSLHPADYFRDEAAARALFATPSPLTRIIEQVREQTSLATPGKPGLKIGASDAGARVTAEFESLRGTDVPGFISVLQKAWRAQEAARTDPSPAAAAAAAAAMVDLKAADYALPSEDLHTFAAEARGQGASAQAGSSADALRQEYRQNVLPACLRVTQGAYPFVSSATRDAQKSDVMALFGQGGALQQFVEGRLSPHVDKGGTLWRWNANDPVAAALQSAPARFQEAQDLRLLLTDGLQMQIYALEFSPGVNGVELRIGSTTHVFRANDPRPYDYHWGKDDNATAGVTFQGPADYIDAAGPWAVFRLFGPPAHIENLRPENVFKVTLSHRSSSAAFKVVMSGGLPNPFRGGPWNFRCPAEL